MAADGIEVVRDDRGGGIRDERLAGAVGAARRVFGSKVAVNRNLATEPLAVGGSATFLKPCVVPASFRFDRHAEVVRLVGALAKIISPAA